MEARVKPATMAAVDPVKDLRPGSGGRPSERSGGVYWSSCSSWPTCSFPLGERDGERLLGLLLLLVSLLLPGRAVGGRPP